MTDAVPEKQDSDCAMFRFRPTTEATRTELSSLDALFLELEDADDSASMHIGGALLFEPAAQGDRPPSIGAVRELLASRLDVLPHYLDRLSDAHVGGFARPMWESDQRFDLAAHVRHATLPDPGGDEQLLEWLSDFYSHRLDRTRPLWELILLGGLKDGRWALAWKTHHCLVDGVGSVDVAHLLLDVSPNPARDDGPQSPAVADRHAHLWPLVPVRQAASVALTAVGTAARGIAHPRAALESWRAALELVVGGELHAAPRLTINRPIGSTRRVLAVRFPLDEIKEIRRTLGGTVNDVLLSVATGGLRSLLLTRGDRLPAAGVRAMVPVNLRGEDGSLELGNHVAALSVALPVAEEDPIRRYELVMAATSAAKSGSGASGSRALLALAALAPPAFHAALVRSVDATRLFNLTITNVPGPTLPLYAFGARLVDVIPVVPLAQGQTIGIAIVSYAGGVTFGICCDRTSVPDVDGLADGIFGSLVELDAAAHSARSAEDHQITEGCTEALPSAT